jgi:hypothetical protein
MSDEVLATKYERRDTGDEIRTRRYELEATSNDQPTTKN